uniref:Uncharacterized protein n=1 Tax=Amphimedon queenslandica TaxID=400682 RepID=A0A1X7UUI0_AMPQE
MTERIICTWKYRVIAQFFCQDKKIETAHACRVSQLVPGSVHCVHITPNGGSTHLIQTDSGLGYRHPKARLGRKHIRPWKWMPFTI